MTRRLPVLLLALVGCSAHTDRAIDEEPMATNATTPATETPTAIPDAEETVDVKEVKTATKAEPAPPPPADATAGEAMREKKKDAGGAAVGRGKATESARMIIAQGTVSAGASAAYDVDAPVVPDPTTSGEGYRDYGVNGFAIAEEDRLSTFSIDVDNASYEMARRKLVEGYLPAPASVRVEEFVNYFQYDYKPPQSGDPFAVDAEAVPDPWHPGHELVRIGVQAKKVARDQRPAVHLTFLVDTSGSMQSDDKLGLVKRTLKLLTHELQDGDTVAIATYAGNTSIALQPTPISRTGDIDRALDRLTADGSTAMGAGIDLAYQLADKSYAPGAINRVIVCSDGDANVGNTDPDSLARRIHAYAEKGITLTTTGFGEGNYQDTMMERLADQGDGNYFYIDSEIEARRVFVDRLTSTLDVVAKDVKLQVEWNPEAVDAYRLVGYENRDIADKDFRNDKVDAGEVGAGHEVTAIYEVIPRSGYHDALATVHVRNKAPGPDAPATERAYAIRSSVLRSSFDEATAQTRLAIAAATFAEVLRESPHAAEIDLRSVERVAKQAARAEYAEDAELVKLIQRAEAIKGPVSIR